MLQLFYSVECDFFCTLQTSIWPNRNTHRLNNNKLIIKSIIIIKFIIIKSMGIHNTTATYLFTQQN